MLTAGEAARSGAPCLSGTCTPIYPASSEMGTVLERAPDVSQAERPPADGFKIPKPRPFRHPPMNILSDRPSVFASSSFNPVAPFGIPKLARLTPAAVAVRFGCVAAALLMLGLA